MRLTGFHSPHFWRGLSERFLQSWQGSVHAYLAGGSTMTVVVEESVGSEGWVGGSVGFGHEFSRGLVGELLSLCVLHVEVEQAVFVEVVSAET